MAKATTQDIDDSMYFESPQERIAYEKNFRRAILGIRNPRNAPPIEAPRDQATFTTSGGIAKPIGLKEVADLYSVSPSMSNLRGKGPAPSTGPASLSMFEGAGGTTRIVGKVFIDRWDDLIASQGLFSRPDYSWDGNDNTSIGNNSHWRACLNNWWWLVDRLLSDPNKVISVKNLTYTIKSSQVTKDNISGKKSTSCTWTPKYLPPGGGIGQGTAKSQSATTTNYNRHIKTSVVAVVVNDAIDKFNWPAGDWTGLKTWIAGGFLMQFSNGEIAHGEAAWPNYFEADIDITVKI